MSDDVFEKAVLYLLAILQERGSVAYSTFFDGTQATFTKLSEAMGVDERCCAHVLIELAVDQLRAKGVVSVELLASKLADDTGDNDYAITLTDEGRQRIRTGPPLVLFSIV